jgi:hypothetical protein
LDQEETGPGMPLDSGAAALYLQGMTGMCHMSDRARMPWRFFGALRGVTARFRAFAPIVHP